jgi:hypothetical protein
MARRWALSTAGINRAASGVVDFTPAVVVAEAGLQDAARHV